MAAIPEDMPLITQTMAVARPISFQVDLVELAVGDKGLLELMDRDKLLVLLQDFFGRRPRLEMSHDAAAGGASAPVRLTREERERLEKEILEHPLLKETQKLFNGEFVDVRIKGKIHEPSDRPGLASVSTGARTNNEGRQYVAGRQPGGDDPFKDIKKEDSMAKGMGPMSNLVKQAQKMQQQIAKLRRNWRRKPLKRRRAVEWSGDRQWKPADRGH